MLRRNFLGFLGALPFSNLSWIKQEIPDKEIQQIHEKWSKWFKHKDPNLSLILEGQHRKNEKIDEPVIQSIEGRVKVYSHSGFFRLLSIPLVYRTMKEFKPKGSYEQLNSLYTFKVDANYPNWYEKQNSRSPIELDNQCGFCIYLTEEILKELRSKFSNKITVSGFYFSDNKILMNYEGT